MFQVLIRDQEFKQNIADARRIAQECLSLDFNDYRSQAELKSDRKYESTDESTGTSCWKIKKPKLRLFILSMSLYKQKTNLIDQPCQRCHCNVFSKPNYDNIDFEMRMEPVAANIIDVCTNQMENIARNIFEEMMYDHFDHTHEWNGNQLATSMPPSTKYHASGSNIYVPNVQRGDFTPTESCMSHPSEFSYYTTISAVPYNWAANAPDPYSDLADDEYFRENLFVPKLDLSYMNENHPVISDTDSSMLSLSSCKSEGAFKNWLKRNDMYESEDTSSVSLSIYNVPREDDFNEKEQAVVKRRILERINEKIKPGYESEIAEIFTEHDRYKQEETRRSDVSMGFVKANIDVTSAEVNDFTKPKESQDILQATETKDEASEGSMTEHQSRDIEFIDESDRERRVIKAAKWVLAVDTFMQRKKELKESERLFRIEHLRYFDLESSRSSMSGCSNFEQQSMFKSDISQDKRDSLGTRMGDKEFYEEQLKSDTSQDKKDNLGTSIRDKECNEEQIKLSDTIEDNKQMKEIVDQKSNILSNSDCVSLDSMDIDIASILGSDFGKGEGDTVNAKILETVSLNEAPKPVEPVERPLFRKPPLPPNAYLRIQAILREKAKQKDIEDSENEESTESTNNVTSNRKRRCNDEYSDDETDSFTSETDCSDNYLYESDFSEETHESDSFCSGDEPDNGNNEMNDIIKDSNIKQGLITHENAKGSKQSLQDIYTQKDFSTAKGDLSPENEYSEKLSASVKIETKNNANKHDIKESNIRMPIEQNKKASTTESQFISNIGGDGNTGLYVRKENSFKLTKYKNDNERCTGFTEPSATNLDDMVANETEISKFSKSHSNTESVDQKWHYIWMYQTYQYQLKVRVTLVRVGCL
ncbi:unnamed protein product [Mytilus edulis]|uniref:Uncharacterized protein n=1 Tax=Mytilus edulis TaxID=6550 RepID=A0A8S3UDA3_MYTED|nr:unnamed protein product [Mytilus edulis]